MTTSPLNALAARLESAAERLISAGVLAAAAAFATGWSSRAGAEERDPRYALRPHPREAARARQFGALGAAGWLGGHLGYTLGAPVTARTTGAAPARRQRPP